VSIEPKKAAEILRANEDCPDAMKLGALAILAMEADRAYETAPRQGPIRPFLMAAEQARRAYLAAAHPEKP
jgi:hypothetical protein